MNEKWDTFAINLLVVLGVLLLVQQLVSRASATTLNL